MIMIMMNMWQMHLCHVTQLFPDDPVQLVKTEQKLHNVHIFKTLCCWNRWQWKPRWWWWRWQWDDDNEEMMIMLKIPHPFLLGAILWKPSLAFHCENNFCLFNSLFWIGQRKHHHHHYHHNNDDDDYDVVMVTIISIICIIIFVTSIIVKNHCHRNHDDWRKSSLGMDRDHCVHCAAISSSL